MSLVLMAYIVTGVSIETLQVLGNIFNIARPELVPAVLWVAWAYFLLRYYQLYRDLADSGPRDAYYRFLDRIAIRRAREQVPAKLGNAFLSGGNPRDYRWRFHDERVTDRGPPLWCVSLSATAQLKGSSHVMTNMNETVLVGGRWDSARAWAAVAFHTRFFTEYVLPGVVACAPIVAWLVVAAQ